MLGYLMRFGPAVRRLQAGFGLLEVLLSLALSSMLLSLALTPLQAVMASRRIDADLQSLESALHFAHAVALFSGHPVQVAGLHIRCNQTRNGVRRPSIKQPNPWVQGVLLYANPPGMRADGYDKREDLRDYSFLSQGQVSSGLAAYQMTASSHDLQRSSPVFVVIDAASRRCATAGWPRGRAWPELCHGPQCAGCPR